MYQEKTGVNAGNVWNALNENGAMTGKDLKKAAKLKNDKELYLALGWLLREDKVEITEEAKEIKVTLK
ncbi:MAG: winged helix-turn-helix domain-containing protein [Bacteroidaceae bacterium]|nr:winged helix-turn-helix domain-containing protein [Bacteroidaceae bacterium]